MKHQWKLFAPALGLLLLTACGQQPPETEPAAAAPAEPEASAPAGEQLASVDADGNVAPFGFASREPVPVPPAEGGDAAPAAEETMAAAATSALYGTHCVACHGMDAGGVEGLGLSLVDSQLVASSDELALAEFLKVGRLPDSPDSVTGVPMPAFAWMNDEQLAEITGYLKSLQN